MKIRWIFLMCSLILFTHRGLMADQFNPDVSSWITFQDKVTGFRADFPRTPIEMAFDLPFHNIPPKSQVRFYSVPTQKGLFVLSTLRTADGFTHELKKDELYQYFKDILVPYFFYNPAIFWEPPIYHFQSSQKKGENHASFQFLFEDFGVKKRLEGTALVLDQTLHIAFYLASEENFDPKLLNHFLESLEY